MSGPEIDLAGIRARAMAATPGPWVSFREGMYHGVEAEGPAPVSVVVWGNDYESGVQGNSVAEGHFNAAHIAGMDPPTTIKLCDEIERLRAALAEAPALRAPGDAS